MVIWLTGLPGAGKTTIANILLHRLRDMGKQAVLLDGDALRNALQMHGYDAQSRKSMALTYARLSQMFSLQGSIAICATVSMFDSVRVWNAQNITDYLEIYVKVSETVLQARNQKGLYSTSAGEVQNPHGFDLARIKKVEEPKKPHLVISNDGEELPGALVDKILAKMIQSKRI